MNRHEEYRTEPLVQRQLGILEYRTLKDGEGRAALTALEAAIASPVRVYAATIRTSNNTIGINLFLNELEAGYSALEVSENLREGVEM